MDRAFCVPNYCRTRTSGITRIPFTVSAAEFLRIICVILDEIFFVLWTLHASGLSSNKAARFIVLFEGIKCREPRKKRKRNSHKNAFAACENYVLCIRGKGSHVFIIFNGSLCCATMSCFVKWNIFLSVFAVFLPVYQLKCFSAHYFYNFFDGDGTLYCKVLWTPTIGCKR